MSDTSTSPRPSVVGFAALLDVLGFTADEFVSLGHQKPGGKFRTAVLAPADAIDAIARTSPNVNMFFGLNPVAGPPRRDGGRGSESDVTRLAAVWCDLDVKPGGCRDLEVAHAIVDELSSVLGSRPSAVTHSGHGLHAYWPVDDGRITDTLAARALLRRWGRLVKAVAEDHGAQADGVFDLPRMLRAPGSWNNKSSQAVPVVCHPDNGGPLALAEVGERLDEHGISEEDTDRRDRAQLSDPDGWVFADGTCSYVSALIDGLPDDGPKPGGGRHQWLLSQATRLACGWRLGCITEADYRHAGKLLGQRLVELRAATGEQVGRFEVINALEYGVETAAAKADDDARAELGDHPHYGTATEFDDTATEFDEPIPLTQVVAIPPFPVEAFAEPVAAMVGAVAEATQTDLAMAGASALSALSTCAGGHAEIEIRPGWREPLCLYTATVAEPGERKSAVQQAMTRAILDVEKHMTEAMMPARMEAQALREIAIKAMEAEIRNAAKEGTDKATANAITRAAEANIEVPPIPRLVADDCTPEAAASLLAEQGGRLAIISAEGGIFDIIAGRYNGNVPNLDMWLKGHSGDMIRIDRKGRDPEYIPRPALTLGLMIQPEVLRTIAAQRTFRGRGLIARFLYALPVSRVGRRHVGAKPLSRDISAAYDARIRALATGMAEWLSDPAVLVLTPGAHDEIQAIEAELEPMLGDDGELAGLKDWGSKYVGAVARIAGILHLAELGAQNGPTTPVGVDSVIRAAEIGDYFKAAAVAAFQVMNADLVTADAVYLLGRIERLGADEVSERDMFRASTRSRFRDKAAMALALHRLVEHGYLIPLAKPASTGGRPASQRYKHVAKGTKLTKGVP